MGRSKPVSNSKPQAKTAHIKRVVPGGLSSYQKIAPDPQQGVYCRFQSSDAWTAKLAEEEQYYGGSFFGADHQNHTYASKDEVDDFLYGMMSDLCAMDGVTLTSSTSEHFMDCDPALEDLMMVDDPNDMDVDIVIQDVDESIFTVAMDVVTVFPNNYSPMITDCEVSPFSIPWQGHPAMNEGVISVSQFFPARPRRDYGADLASVERELAFSAQALEVLPPPSSYIPTPPVFDSPVRPTYQKRTRVNGSHAHLGNCDVLPPVAVTPTPTNQPQPKLSANDDLDWLIDGLQSLDLSDASASHCGPSPDIPSSWGPSPDVPSPTLLAVDDPPSPSLGSVDVMQSIPELISFDSMDLLHIDSVDPLHSTPLPNSSYPSSSGIWEDLASLDGIFARPIIPEILQIDETYVTFTSSLVREFLDVFELPPIDIRPLPFPVITPDTGGHDAQTDEVDHPSENKTPPSVPEMLPSVLEMKENDIKTNVEPIQKPRKVRANPRTQRSHTPKSPPRKENDSGTVKHAAPARKSESTKPKEPVKDDRKVRPLPKKVHGKSDTSSSQFSFCSPFNTYLFYVIDPDIQPARQVSENSGYFPFSKRAQREAMSNDRWFSIPVSEVNKENISAKSWVSSRRFDIPRSIYADGPIFKTRCAMANVPCPRPRFRHVPTQAPRMHDVGVQTEPEKVITKASKGPVFPGHFPFDEDSYWNSLPPYTPSPSLWARFSLFVFGW
ncbi:hypothetical protein BDZ97DRAFT_1752861 [Flammula alnicola]|nr:hypothetical protein BDZ97DRAFT_1752861 [Flammula alnicola]